MFIFTISDIIGLTLFTIWVLVFIWLLGSSWWGKRKSK